MRNAKDAYEELFEHLRHTKSLSRFIESADEPFVTMKDVCTIGELVGKMTEDAIEDLEPISQAVYAGQKSSTDPEVEGEPEEGSDCSKVNSDNTDDEDLAGRLLKYGYQLYKDVLAGHYAVFGPSTRKITEAAMYLVSFDEVESWFEHIKSQRDGSES